MFIKDKFKGQTMDKVLEFLDYHDIQSVLDIGANVGNYSRTVKYFFPNMRILMIEANPYCEESLKNTGIDYRIACLSDTEKEVEFYIDNDKDIGTGASYYLENTHHYSQKRFIRRNTELLDNVVDDQSFDFIKMDTQGSEVDIIKGGYSVIDKTKFISIEMSLIEYNFNSPQKDEVVSFMESCGFYPNLLVEEHYSKGELIQEDWIFSKR
jgi:FkbM family methyltransferase